MIEKADGMFGGGFRFGLGLVAAIALGIAVAATAATSWNLNRSVRQPEAPYMVTMCDGQGATFTGVCTDDGTVKAGGNSALEHRFSAAYALTLIGTSSAATAYSCDFFTNDSGYTATAADKQKVNSAAITETAQVWSMSGLLDWGWVECTTITGGTLTMTMLVSPL